MDVFDPPDFNSFLKRTAMLHACYAAVANLYRPYELKDGKLNISKKETFNQLITRVEVLISNSGSKRISEIKVLEKLKSEMAVYADGNETEIESATMILLGALVHRYYRLLKGGINSYFWGVRVTDPENTRLVGAIRKALLLTEENTLDHGTTVNVLNIFKKHMLEEVRVLNSSKKPVNIPRYRTYDHLNTDTFLPNLEQLITEHSNALPQQPFKHIEFIQSLAEQLKKDFDLLETEMAEWFAALKKDVTDISLTILQKHLENYCANRKKPTKIKGEITDMLHSHFLQQKENLEYRSFVQAMQDLHLSTRSLVLYGGYILLLYQGETRGDSLTLSTRKKTGLFEQCIQDTLNAKSMPNPPKITNKDLNSVVECLYRYMHHRIKTDGKEQEIIGLKLDCDFFGGMANMWGEVKRLLLALQMELKNESLQVETYNNFSRPMSLF